MPTWYSGGGGEVGILANVLLGKLNRYHPSASFLQEPALIFDIVRSFGGIQLTIFEKSKKITKVKTIIVIISKAIIKIIRTNKACDKYFVCKSLKAR